MKRFCFDVAGMLMKRRTAAKEIPDLRKGIYIVGGKKVTVK